MKQKNYGCHATQLITVMLPFVLPWILPTHANAIAHSFSSLPVGTGLFFHSHISTMGASCILFVERFHGTVPTYYSISMLKCMILISVMTFITWINTITT